MQTASSWTRPGWQLLDAEKKMDSVVRECETLTAEDVAFLHKLEGDLGILADLSRADVLLYCPLAPDKATVVAQARPHSMLPLYANSVVLNQVTFDEEPDVLRALREGKRGCMERRRPGGLDSTSSSAAHTFQEIFPVRRNGGPVIAAVAIETNLIERERHRRRSKAFQRALSQFREMALAGALKEADHLTPFAEHDGILVVDTQHRIQYASGIATSLYRKLGYVDSLLRRHLEDLEADDNSIARESIEAGTCLEREVHPRDLVWLKKAIPLYSTGRRLGRLVGGREPRWRPEGAMLLIRDQTDARRQEEELQVKAAMIKEVHHRVKNNMQTIASLLRLQARRADSDAVRKALQEGINRILSVAVIHEYLSHQDARVINIRDVAQRIITQIREGVMDQAKPIRLDLRGPNVYLPTQPATVCALVINELLLNALEHGYERQDAGTVTVGLKDDGEQVTVYVDDDGAGLPPDFDLEQTGSLGLQIVRTLAQGDLKGRFELLGRDKGVSAVVTFPKHGQGGK